MKLNKLFMFNTLENGEEESFESYIERHQEFHFTKLVTIYRFNWSFPFIYKERHLVDCVPYYARVLEGSWKYYKDPCSRWLGALHYRWKDINPNETIPASAYKGEEKRAMSLAQEVLNNVIQK